MKYHFLFWLAGALAPASYASEHVRNVDRVSSVEVVTAEELTKILEIHSKEWGESNYGKKRGFKPSSLLIQFSSLDKSCAQCIAANAEFDKFASKTAVGSKTRLIRVTWNPWQSAANDPLIKQHGIKGLPTIIQFVMGMRRNKIVGNFSAQELGGLWKPGSMDLQINKIGGASTWTRFNEN